MPPFLLEADCRVELPLESSLGRMARTWEDMIETFRALGGTADNIVRGNGARGRGIFPIDKSKPARLHVPENLLISDDDIVFIDGRLKIRSSAAYGRSEREFFEEYQDIFSWGDTGRSECSAFIQGLEELPPEVLSLLFPDGIAKPQSHDDHERIEQEFVQSRKLERNGKCVLMPVVELVNHGPTARPFATTNGVSIEGMFSDEVLVRYNAQDAFGIFLSHGFASPELVAYSVAARREGPQKLIVGRKTNDKSKRGSLNIPNFRIDGDTLEVSCLMIGNKRFPRLPKGIFCHIAREAGWTNVEEEFDAIVHRNRMTFLHLLQLLEPHEGKLIPTVRKMIRYQLEAMSHCIGTREL